MWYVDNNGNSFLLLFLLALWSEKAKKKKKGKTKHIVNFFLELLMTNTFIDLGIDGRNNESI